MPVTLLILGFDAIQVLRFPVEADQPRHEQLGAVFAGFGEGLVEEEGVADGSVEDAIKDVGEGFSLRTGGSEPFVLVVGDGRERGGDGG